MQPVPAAAELSLVHRAAELRGNGNLFELALTNRRRCSRLAASRRSVVVAFHGRAATPAFAVLRRGRQRRGYNSLGIGLISRFTTNNNQVCRATNQKNGRGDLLDSVVYLTMFGRFTSSHSTRTDVNACWHAMKSMKHFASFL